MAPVGEEKILKQSVTGADMRYYKVGDYYETKEGLHKVTEVTQNGTLILEKCNWYQRLWYRLSGKHNL
jgi:hypothetical protein